MTKKELEYINSPHDVEDKLKRVFAGKKISIAEVGACDGLDTVRYARMFPNAHIYAWEPRKDNYDMLIENCTEAGVMDRVTAYNLALSDEKGMVKFWSSFDPKEDEGVEWKRGNRSSSIMRPLGHLHAHRWCKFQDSRVPVDKLDNFRHKVDFIHMDVQGAEFKVLRGGQRTLRGCTAIWLEVSNMRFYCNEVLKNDMEDFLKTRGFVLAEDCCGKRNQGDELWVKG